MSCGTRPHELTDCCETEVLTRLIHDRANGDDEGVIDANQCSSAALFPLPFAVCHVLVYSMRLTRDGLDPRDSFDEETCTGDSDSLPAPW